ncbi:MAG TPA: hypothetical protein VG347_04615 [Verrucomicrobiae bacterium]|nr:hypothetical protein [Verrucomicrobiae bacterium]
MSAILTLLQAEAPEPCCEQVMFRRPMVDLGAAMAMLDLNEQQLRRAIERGRIRWAFNLAVGGRNHVQILVRSLANYTDRTIIQPATPEGVANMVLPPESATSGTVRGTELQFGLNIRSQHVTKLLDAGLIAESEMSNGGKGRNGSHIFTRESIVRLLVTRRMK